MAGSIRGFAMSEAARPLAGVPPVAVKTQAGKNQFVRRLVRSKIALVASFVFLLVTLAAIFAPLITSNDPASLALIRRLKPPGYVDLNGNGYMLGTDTIGRDVYSRLVFGARISLIV